MFCVDLDYIDACSEWCHVNDRIVIVSFFIVNYLTQCIDDSDVLHVLCHYVDVAIGWIWVNVDVSFKLFFSAIEGAHHPDASAFAHRFAVVVGSGYQLDGVVNIIEYVKVAVIYLVAECSAVYIRFDDP